MNKQNRSFIIHGIIALAIYAIFSFVPAVDPISPMGMRLIGLLIGYYYALITMGNPGLVSVVTILLFGFSGYTQLTPAIVGAAGSIPMNIILSVMLLGGVMSISGLAKGIAEKIISSKMANRRPWMLTFLIMLASVIPAALLTTSLPILIILWGIIKNIFDVAGYKKGEKWPALMMCLVMFFAQFGASTMPYASGLMSNFGLFQGMNPEAPMFHSGGYLISSLLMDSALVVVVWLLIRFVIKPDVTKLKNYEAPRTKTKFTRDQNRALGILIMFIIIALLPSLLPAGAAKDFFSNFGVIGAAYLGVVIALIIRNEDGTPYMKFIDVAKCVPWHIVFMIGTLMVLCSTFSDPELGIGEALTMAITPIVESIGLFGSFAVLVIIATLATNILDNSLVSVLIMTVIGPVCGTLGVSPSGYAALLERPCEFAILTPAASPGAAMLYGETEEGWVNKKTIVSFAAICICVFIVLFILIGFGTVNLVGK